MKTLILTPLFRASICFALGIVIGLQLPYHSTYTVLFVMALIYHFLQHIKPIHLFHKRHIKGIGLLLLLLLAGALISSWNESNRKNNFNFNILSKTSIYGSFRNTYPTQSCRYKSILSISHLKHHEVWKQACFDIMIYHKHRIELYHPYYLTGEISTIDTTSQNQYTRHNFNLLKKGIKYVMFNPSMEGEHSSKGKYFSAGNAWVLQAIKNHIDSLGLSKNCNGILKAICLGDKSDIPSEVKRLFTNTGAMHILAVSGFHVGLAYLLVVLLLRPTRRFKYHLKLQSIVGLITIWAFVILTGLSPSAQRAAAMFSIYLIAKLLNVKVNTLNLLGASALIFLTIQPDLISNLSFQYSYLAVMGIILIYSKLARLMVIKNTFIKRIWEVTCISISAQLFTLPLSLFYFHSIPSVSLFTNLVVTPYAFIVFTLGYASLLISNIPVLQSFITILVNRLTEYLIAIMQLLADLPNSQLESEMNLLQVIGFYSVLLMGLNWFKTKTYKSLMILLIVFWLMVCLI